MPTLPSEAYTSLKNGSVICRIINGMWQLSGHHGFKPEASTALVDMKALVQAGFTTFDLADHYGPAEDFVGQFRESGPVDPCVQFHTKWVPQPGPMGEGVVLQALDVSRRRMKTQTLDLVAFHWWDYSDNRYLDMLRNAQALSQRAPPVLTSVSLTNFDTQRLKQIVDDAGVDIISNQVSFSIVDTRPLDKGMCAFAQSKGIQLLVYGTLLGGLLSDKWVGKEAPTSKAQLDTASLGKYYNFVRKWGSWTLFQELLGVLHTLSKKYNVSVANVSVRWVLQQPGVGGCILGTRLGHTAASHFEENRKVFTFALSEEDMALIGAVQKKANRLADVIGDCGDEYR